MVLRSALRTTLVKSHELHLRSQGTLSSMRIGGTSRIRSVNSITDITRMTPLHGAWTLSATETDLGIISK
ncbi:hypothetical protein GDO78_013830 [Eleutherodactylus coqui]|uniref:Uncharacterized protein n=1 Tax=Eleutherodactylus coqui TaxID=57060 RepID=A0A8J6E943_ELECQ|nr:hypothetical protein GDO78_013830 [Eleutherodactylus coqui]